MPEAVFKQTQPPAFLFILGSAFLHGLCLPRGYGFGRRLTKGTIISSMETPPCWKVLR